jgi:hypothetical protein
MRAIELHDELKNIGWEYQYSAIRSNGFRHPSFPGYYIHTNGIYIGFKGWRSTQDILEDESVPDSLKEHIIYNMDVFVKLMFI